MRDPRQALAEARQRAASRVEAGGDGGARRRLSRRGGPGGLDGESFGGSENGVWHAGRRLARWAIIEPDRAEVYSTRRLGAPITALKRLLVRLLRQYLGEVVAQQIRFNAHAAAYMLALEDRVRQLELELEALRERVPDRSGQP